MGKVHRTRTCCKSFVRSEYLETAPSSEPARKKSLYRRHESAHRYPSTGLKPKLSPTPAAIAVLSSWQSSMVTGSPTEPVLKTRMALFEPAVTRLAPSGV